MHYPSIKLYEINLNRIFTHNIKNNSPMNCHYFKCIFIYFLKKDSFLVHVYWCYTCTYVCGPWMCWCPQGPEEKGHSPGMNYRWLWAIRWVLGINLGPPEEQPALFAAEPSPQSFILFWKYLPLGMFFPP